MTAPRLSPGQVVAGKYSIRAMLGYGGATATYAASLAPSRDVVLKLFSPQLAQRADVLGALQEVAAFTNGLPDATLPIVEMGFDPATGAPFMVTDLCTTASLTQAVERGPLPLADVVLLLRGISRAVDAAHAQRIGHGALKPQNVFVGPAPQRAVRVSDFGVAVARAGLPTAEGYSVAAPWLAPEQMQGAPGGAPADIFAAGLVAFFAATGRSYWRACQGPTPDLNAWQSEIGSPRVPPSVRAGELGANLPPALDAALLRALALNPAERFTTIGELTDALAKAGGAGPQKAMAMTMPLTAMPQAAQDLIRQQTAPEPEHDTFAGETTIAIPSPIDTRWVQSQEAQRAQALQATTAQPIPQTPAYQRTQFMGQAQPPAVAAMIAAVQGGYSSAPPGPVPAGAQPTYALGPAPESSVVVPKSKAGLFIGLAVGGLVLVSAVVAAVFLVPRHGSSASSGSSAKPDSTQSTAVAVTPPPATAAGSAASAPPVETLDAAAAPSAAPAGSPAGLDAGSAEATQGLDGGGGTSPMAELTIVCVPDCDSIKLDDRTLDTNDAGIVAPEPMEVAVGTHVITAGRASYPSQTRRFSIKPGQTLKESFHLSKGAPVNAKPCGKFLERCPN